MAPHSYLPTRIVIEQKNSPAEEKAQLGYSICYEANLSDRFGMALSHDMELDNFVEGVQDIISSDKLSKLPKNMRGLRLANQIKAFANVIPSFGGFIAQEIEEVANYRNQELYRKLFRYVANIKDVPVEKRCRFAEQIRGKAKDNEGNVIVGMIDSLDNINKQDIFANLTIAMIHEFITVDDFFRLHHILARIPYVDLNYLPQYDKDFYDESGDTELLYATGALAQSVIDAGGADKYVLSKLGRMLVRFGLQGNVRLETGKKKDININLQIHEYTEDEIDKLTSDSPWDKGARYRPAMD